VHRRFDRRALRSRRDRQPDAVILPVASDPKELIDLAVRMGIPTEDAFHRVVQHLTYRQLSLDVVEPDGSLRRTSLSAGTNGASTTLRVRRTVEGAQCTNRKIHF
jgi:hypothetical protein